MSTQRGRIEIRGFDPDSVTERDPLTDWEVTQHADRESRWMTIVRRVVRDRLALMGASVVLVMLLSALFAKPIKIAELGGFPIQPLDLTPHDPSATLVGDKYEAPSASHPMGTDRLGRDIFSRVMFGARFSVTIGIVVTSIAATFGVIYGGISGYLGGMVDALLMRIVDVVYAFPGLVLALVIVSLLGKGYLQLVAAFVAVGWVAYARLIRGEILKVKQNEYVLAAKALGATDTRVLARHVIPNAIAPVIVQATLSVGTVVIGVAALGFLGLGFDPGTPEWGTMLDAEQDTITSVGDQPWRWWATVFPGLMIFLFVMSMNLIGDAINDALDTQGGTTGNVGGG